MLKRLYNLRSLCIHKNRHHSWLQRCSCKHLRLYIHQGGYKIHRHWLPQGCNYKRLHRYSHQFLLQRYRTDCLLQSRSYLQLQFQHKWFRLVLLRCSFLRHHHTAFHRRSCQIHSEYSILRLNTGFQHKWFGLCCKGHLK